MPVAAAANASDVVLTVAGLAAPWLADAAVQAVDHREIDIAVGGLRHRKLQRLAGLQRHLRDHVERLTADRDLYLVVAEELQHLGVDHGARLQHDIARQRPGHGDAAETSSD